MCSPESHDTHQGQAVWPLVTNPSQSKDQSYTWPLEAGSSALWLSDTMFFGFDRVFFYSFPFSSFLTLC